jgi:hypothetical protein
MRWRGMWCMWIGFRSGRGGGLWSQGCASPCSRHDMSSSRYWGPCTLGAGRSWFHVVPQPPLPESGCRGLWIDGGSTNGELVGEATDLGGCDGQTPSWLPASRAKGRKGSSKTEVGLTSVFWKLTNRRDWIQSHVYKSLYIYFPKFQLTHAH